MSGIWHSRNRLLHISRDRGCIFCSRSTVDRKIVESTFLGSRHFRAFEVSRPSKSVSSSKNAAPYVRGQKST